MYHHGIVPIVRPEQLLSIRNRDVVVVTWNNRRLDDREFADLLKTTSQMFFVEHPLPKKHHRAVSTERPPQLPFDGDTIYKSEYVKHPLARRELVKKPLSYSQSNLKEPTGKTTYEVHYPWHDVPIAAKQSKMSSDGTQWETGPFQGCTSYMQDYVAHPTRPRCEMPTSARPRPKSASYVPFEGKTTYEVEYTEKPLSARTLFRPKGSKQERIPFEGASHYQTHYVKPWMEWPMIYLEPELTSEVSKAPCNIPSES